MIWYKIILLHYCGWLFFFFTGFFISTLKSESFTEVGENVFTYFFGSLIFTIFTLTIYWCLI